MTTLAVPTGATRLATTMPLGPCCDLSVDDVLLDGGRQRLALGDREAKVLRPLRLLLEYRDFRGITRGAVFGGDLKKNLHAHGEPPAPDRRQASFPQEAEWKARDRSGTPIPGYFEANWTMASVKRAAAAIAAILVREGIDYAQSKAVFKAARERAGLRATPERRGNVDRLTVEEELRFLDRAYAQDGRTGLMLQTLLETGARASELVQLRVEDVSLVERVITIRQGKGGQTS